MYAREQDINSEYDTELKQRLILTIDSIPYATAIYIADAKVLHLNKFAAETMGMDKNKDFDVENWIKLNPHMSSIAEKMNNTTLLDQKTLITFENGKKEVVTFNITKLKNRGAGDIFIVYFSKASAKYAASVASSLYILKDEIKKLNPYLNKTGKSILDKIIVKYFSDEKSSVGVNDLMYCEREILLLQETFPQLSLQEIILCSLLLNNMDNNDIAFLTKKSLNSIFVTIHRINKKLKVKDRHELIELLQSAIYNKDDNINRILPSVEDFDV